MQTTRRDMLTGTVGAAALAIVPSLPIRELADVKTLERLAAEGRYFSVAQGIPQGVLQANLEILLNGSREHGYIVREVYAPGDNTGWAVVYRREDGDILGTEVVHGNWRVNRLPQITA